MSRMTPGFLPPRDPRWVYDDPSGVPDEVPVTVHVPESLLLSMQEEADRTGVTPAAWLLDLVQRSLSPARRAVA
jgi:hypothetical protein